MEFNMQLIACDKPHITSHGMEVFRCHGRGRLCPALRVSCLKKILSPVIYDQFFCYFPVSQKRDSFCKQSDMDYKFFYHCHCASPGSLQCLAARQMLLKCFDNVPVNLFSERVFRTVPVCCNSWVCCPVIFLGAFSMKKKHCYFLFCGPNGSSFHNDWFDYQKLKEIMFCDSCSLVVVHCKCKFAIKECIRRTEIRYNIVRMLYSCTFLFRPSNESAWHL